MTASLRHLYGCRFILLLLISCIFIGFYCCELNRQLYQHRAPFFDSLSYNEQLFRVMTISQQQGVGKSLEEACFSNTTVCLPFIIASFVAQFVSPSRFVGVWIQAGFLTLFLFSLYYYLSRIRKLSCYVSSLGCLAFCCANCIYYENGGISDFRMDFGLCVTFGITTLWYLTAIDQPTKLHFCLLGLSAASCCLARATAPVYLVFCFGPLLVFDLVTQQRKLQITRGIGIAILLAVACSGWFFVLNFDYLHYYYAVWNTDANAKISFAEAWTHVKLARRCIGEPLTLLLVSWGIALLIFRTPISLATETVQQTANVFSRLQSHSFDPRFAWIGIAPIAMMVVRRAGLNPFVTMPSVIGLTLFFLVPIATRFDSVRNPKLARVFMVCLIVCLTIAFARGWRRHQAREFNSMSAQQQIIDHILEDSQSVGQNEIRFAVMQSSELNSDSLYSTLLFDRPDASPELDRIFMNNTTLTRIKVFSKSAQTDWEEIPEATDDQKMDYLMRSAIGRANYLVVPDAETAKYLNDKVGHNVINRYLVPLRTRLEPAVWQKVSPPIQVSQQETVEIYRRNDFD